MKKEMPPILRGLRIAGMVVVGVLTAACFGLVFGLIIKALWNWLMPAVFALPTISYWQAVGLVLLARLLVGTMGAHGKSRQSRHLHERWENNQDWDYEDHRSWRRWQYYNEWWRTEGKAAYAQYVENKTNQTNMANEVSRG